VCCFSPLAAPAGLVARLLALFSRPRVDVGRTRIFARIEDGVQHLVYSMALSTPADVAMVLPLPVAPGLGEAALSFVDLSQYPRVLDDVSQLVTPLMLPTFARGGPALFPRARPRLIVHTVGSFDASFVPSISDFDRLDPRFRLPQDVWSAHPEYGGFGFAVFKLTKGKKQEIHPMALRFSTSEPGSIFFPTLHVHDGELHPDARFDHQLFYQAPEAIESTLERPDGTGGTPLRSFAPARDGIQIERASGLVAPDLHIHAWTLEGKLANADTRVRLGRAPEHMRGAA
jgi:hypothetical protein